MNKIIIIGGGISGLSALHFIKTMHPHAQVTLYEATGRVGGTIGVDMVDGYSIDWGPNGFLDKEPITLELVRQLDFSNALEKANANVQKRFILRHGQLRQVPMTPGQFMQSDILSLRGKFRLLMEPFTSSKVAGKDESIYDFARRHIGQEAADYLVQPMVSGIYGGLAQKLSLQSAFPVMAEMEATHGTLFKAMRAKRKEAKKQGTQMGGPAGPRGWLTTFENGLHSLIRQLFVKYQENVVTGKRVSGLERQNGSFQVNFEDGSIDNAQKCVLAVPAYQAAAITDGLSSSLARYFETIPYAPISVVGMGYAQRQVGVPLDGFGFLVPQKEQRSILGSIWTSSIFKNRAPAGKFLFRTMIGGDGDHQSVKLSDDELISKVRSDLEAILHIQGAPEVVKIYRWQRGIPQFLIGHTKVVAMIEKELDRIGNLFITGNAYYGVGLNDCIKQSYQVSRRIL